MAIHKMRALTLLISLGMLTLAGCGPRNQYVAPPPPHVTVAQPVVKDVVDYLEFTGTTRATDVVDIRARVNGYLKKIAFSDGAMVHEGDLLFLIEPEPFEVALNSAKAKLQKAEALYSLAVAELKRTEPLVTQGALSQQELDLKKADLATAKAGVGEAKSAIRQAELNLAYTRVLAPIKGRISRHMVDVGNLVQAEQTVLTRLESYQPIHAYFTVSESEMVRLMELARQKKLSRDELKGKEIRLGLTGEVGFPHVGRLDFSELGIEPGTGTQMRRAIFPNEDQSLVPGMFVRVRLQVGEPAPRLLVSERALGADQRGAYVLVVNEKDQNKVEQRPVKFGVAIDGMRVIESGIKPEDWVIVNGLQRARPGSPVNPEKLGKMPGDPAAPAPQADPKLAADMKPAEIKPADVKPADGASPTAKTNEKKAKP